MHTARDDLIQPQVALTRDIVARIGGCLPDFFDFGELAGHGIAALIEASREYAGLPGHFADFARTRITRALVRSVQTHVWYRSCALPCALRMRDVCSGLTQAPGASYGRPELAAALGVGAAQLAERLCAVSAVMAVEPQHFLGQGEQTPQLVARRISAGIASLPELERTVIALYYLDDLSLLEIAQILDADLPTARSLFALGCLAIAASHAPTHSAS